MIVNNPTLNQPAVVVCKKCGCRFMSKPYANVFSDERGSLVILCPDCADEALKSGKVSRIIY